MKTLIIILALVFSSCARVSQSPQIVDIPVAIKTACTPASEPMPEDSSSHWCDGVVVSTGGVAYFIDGATGVSTELSDGIFTINNCQFEIIQSCPYEVQ